MCEHVSSYSATASPPPLNAMNEKFTEFLGLKSGHRVLWHKDTKSCSKSVRYVLLKALWGDPSIPGENSSELCPKVIRYYLLNTRRHERNLVVVKMIPTEILLQSLLRYKYDKKRLQKLLLQRYSECLNSL